MQRVTRRMTVQRTSPWINAKAAVCVCPCARSILLTDEKTAFLKLLVFQIHTAGFTLVSDV